MSSSNQQHVKVLDLELENRRWKQVESLLISWCRKNNVDWHYKTPPDELGVGKSNKVLIATVHDIIPDLKVIKEYDNWANKTGKKVFILCDSWVDQEYHQFANVEVFAAPKLLSSSMLEHPANRDEIKQSRLFNMFMHRCDSVRQSWFYYLHLNQLIDKGYVSFRLFQIETNLTGKDLFTYNHNNGLNTLPHFNQAYNALIDQVPFANFADKPDLSPYVLDSKYSIVDDTFSVADDTASYYLSEKVIRSLQLPTANLLFVQKGTMQRMHNDGFYIDPTVLEIDDQPWQVRQQMLLNILVNDLLDTNPDTLYNQAMHNYNLIKSWLEEILQPTFFDEMFERIISA